MQSPLTTTPRTLGILAGTLLPATLLAIAWAQAPTAPGVPAMPPAGSPSAAADGGSSGAFAFFLLMAVLAALAITVKLLDLKTKRETEAVHLQARIADALLRDARLSRLQVTATVHVPTWRGSPATIEVRGELPKPELRENVLRLLVYETARLRSDFRIEDRIIIVPSAGWRAA